MREGFGVAPGNFALLRTAQRRHHVHPFAAGRFAKADETNGFQPVANFARALITASKSTPGAGSRSKTKRPGRSGFPGWQFHGCSSSPRQLRNFRKTLHSIDLKVRLFAARNFGQREHARRSRHRMALKKMLAVDAVGRANNRAWPPLQMRDHPASDGFVIARQLQFGDGLAIAGVGPENFLRLLDRHTRNDGIARLASSLSGLVVDLDFVFLRVRGVSASSRLEFHTASSRRLAALEHKGLWLRALAARDLGHRAARRHRSIVVSSASSLPSRANSSRCLISSQLVRLPPLRSRFIRTSTQLPCNRWPSKLNFRFPDLS